MAETKSQEQAFISSGIIILRDDSFDADNPVGKTTEETEKGLQCIRFAFIDEYDDVTGLTNYKLQLNDRNECVVIPEPRNWKPRVHNWNRKRLTAKDREKLKQARAFLEKLGQVKNPSPLVKGLIEKAKAALKAAECYPDDRVASIRLIIDDKHHLEHFTNRSTKVIRECDFNEGDLHDMLRVRAIPGLGAQEDVGTAKMEKSPQTKLPGAAPAAAKDFPGTKVLDRETESADAVMRLMWLINSTKGGEGGWITTAAERGLGKTDAKRDHDKIAPPLLLAQIGDIVILTPDDISATTVPDGDGFTLANIRDDAHFHRKYGSAAGKEKDGRIFFTDTPPGIEPSGTPLMGEMILDPALANFDTRLFKENGEWRPQIKLPLYTVCPNPPKVYPQTDPQPIGYKQPDAGKIPGTNKTSYFFVKNAAKGFMGEFQIGEIPRYQDLSYRPFYLVMEFMHTAIIPFDQVASFFLKYRIVPIGTTIGAAPPLATFADIPILIANTNKVMVYLVEFPAAQLTENSLVIIDQFFRDVGSVVDTFTGTVYLLGLKTAWKEGEIIP